MKLLTSIGNEITEIDLGRVKAGESKIFSFILYNDKDSKLEDIRIELAVRKDTKSIEVLDEVEIVNKPGILGPREKGTVAIKWTPTLKIEAGLKAKIIVNALEVWG